MRASRLILFAATTGYQIRVFADAARRLGFDLSLATDRCHILEDPWGDRAIPVRFERIEESVEALRGQQFDGVVAVGDVVTVWVLTVDQERRRVSLTMLRPGTERKQPEKGAPPPRQQRGGSRPPRGRELLVKERYPLLAEALGDLLGLGAERRIQRPF